MTHTEPRSETISRHVREALNTDARLTERSYAERVMELYHAAVPLHLRRVPFELATTGDAVERAQRSNAQTIHRFLNGETRMPVDIEEAMIDALPDAIRERCMRAMAARRGLLAVTMPSDCGADHTLRTAALLRSTADAVTAIAPMLADGVIDEHDMPHAAAALAELRRVITDATSLQAQINTVITPPTFTKLRSA